MLLTITTTYRPAADLGFVLHKNPDKVHSFDLSYGKASVYYPEASDERCTMALMLEVDPVNLVRSRKSAVSQFSDLSQYVNDRPYVASSLLSVTISKVFNSAFAGKCKFKPHLVNQPLPVEVKLAVVPCRDGEAFIRELFEPLGYRVSVVQHPLDEHFPQWGDGIYFTLTLTHTITIKKLLTHLYVLAPVFDGEKHYYVGEAEIQKLLDKGAGWLENHPAKDIITFRYLKKKYRLAGDAMARMVGEGPDREEPVNQPLPHKEEELEETISLRDLRLNAVYGAFRDCGARRVIDWGCGEGRLLELLLKDGQFIEAVGVDVSQRSLKQTAERLELDSLPEEARHRIKLFQGSLLYEDKRLQGYDAAAVIEAIEHLDPARLRVFERILFECAAPGMIVITTPNFEYNVKFEDYVPGQFRHNDHRFEWTRAQFQQWANRVAERYGYKVEFLAIGPEDENLGAPTQMGVFKR
jgi:3' terminal RNA ribose 2'-O-methyltransferase Hen1